MKPHFSGVVMHLADFLLNAQVEALCVTRPLPDPFSA